MTEGDVVITTTGQAGTLIVHTATFAMVLLRNGLIFCGNPRQLRLPQDAADLEACPIDVERKEPAVKIRKKIPMSSDDNA